jgi:uncharacterized protein
MWKTVSEDCNLGCDYCYYSTCKGKPGPKINRIDSHILEKFIKEYMQMQWGTASFAWQGGEPLLAGLDFFREVVALQAKHAKPQMEIANALQTNGTLITRKWAEFFRTYNFLIGVSLDGPQEIHDVHRVDSQGKGSFERVMNGINHLRRENVDFNILTVLNKTNVTKAKELMTFFAEQNFYFLQFIPCMSYKSQHVDQPGVYEITPEEYGSFLCEAFDYWYNDGNPTMSIRFFDNMVNVYVHRDAELCLHRKTCPKTLILEQNGDAYPCDFYLSPEWKIGNIGTDSLRDIMNHPLYERFLQKKPDLPDKCRSCEWLELCHGGCPRNRGWNEETGQQQTDYFCRSYKQVYAYAHDRMKQLSDTLRERWFVFGMKQFYRGKMPNRNEPCACGSGRKFKNCCLEDAASFALTR